MNRNDSSFVMSYVLENRLRKVKVLQRRLHQLPALFGRAWFGGQKFAVTDRWLVIYTFDLKASSTSTPSVE